MMDYAGRVAQADTYPKLLRLNAKEHGNEIAPPGTDREEIAPETDRELVPAGAR